MAKSSSPSRPSKSWFTMPYKLPDIPVKGDTQVRFPESLVRKFLREYTDKGDVILDPFAGYGTTLLVAQQMGRVGIGIEYEKKKCQYIDTFVKEPSQIIHGDARQLSTYDVPKCDFSITSPPFMQAHHTMHPLTSYTKKGDYALYLKEMQKIYEQVKRVMKKNAVIVLDVCNVQGNKRPLTPLAWDIAHILSKILYLEREVVCCHTGTDLDPLFGDHSYCLIFRNK